MSVIKVLLISADRLFAGQFAQLSKEFTRELDISTAITNFMLKFDTAALTVEPDLIVLPIGLPGLDGFQIIDDIRTAHFKTPILAICNCYAKADLEELHNRDIQGVITTNAAPEELVAAIYAVVDQQLDILQRQFQHALLTLPPLTQPGEKELSEQDRIVLQSLALGLEVAAIAELLELTTIKNVLQSCYIKLDTHKQHLAILKALSLGLIRQPPYLP